MTENQISLPIIDTDRERLNQFLMALYPKGKTLKIIVDDIIRERPTTDRALVTRLAQSLLENERITTQSVKMEEKKISNTESDFIVSLTEIGVKLVWDQLNTYYSEKPLEFFKWLRIWRNKGDEKSTEFYYTTLYSELYQNFDICSVMKRPIQLSDIIEDAFISRKIEVKNESEEEVNKFTNEITDFLKRGVLIGLINQNRSVINNEEVDIFQLSEYGLEGIKYINNKIMIGDQLDSISKSKKQISVPHGIEILKNVFDIPFTRFIILLLLSFALTSFFMILILYTNEPSRYDYIVSFLITVLVFGTSEIFSKLLKNAKNNIFVKKFKK